MVNGIENEYNFVLLFNNKKVCELDPISSDLIHHIFNIKNEESIIKCWRNHLPQKSDILIKIENHMRGISIKKGIKNSVHVEGISHFVEFLKEENIPNDIINEYLLFHFADGTTNGTGKIRISTEDYKIHNQDKIDKINVYFNNPQFIKKAINRFIIRGNNSDYPINALIYGEPDDYIWIDTFEIKNIILSYYDNQSSGIHIGSLQVQPKNRCLNYNYKYIKDRFCVQIKWYNLFDNYMEYKYKKTNHLYSN